MEERRYKIVRFAVESLVELCKTHKEPFKFSVCDGLPGDVRIVRARLREDWDSAYDLHGLEVIVESADFDSLGGGCAIPYANVNFSQLPVERTDATLDGKDE